jgi:hypothetical protein
MTGHRVGAVVGRIARSRDDKTDHRIMSMPAGVSLNVWDFGRQDIMHAMHQFFITKRSVYVIAFDMRQDEQQNRLEYWLKLVQGFAGGSPIVLVGNKDDETSLDIDQGAAIQIPRHHRHHLYVLQNGPGEGRAQRSDATRSRRSCRSSSGLAGLASSKIWRPGSWASR